MIKSLTIAVITENSVLDVPTENTGRVTKRL